MRKTLSFFSVLGLFILAIFSCQKSSLPGPDSVASGTAGPKFTIGIETAGLGDNNTICAGSSFTLTLTALNPGGQPLGEGDGQKRIVVYNQDMSIAGETSDASGTFTLTPPTPSVLPDTYTYFIEFYLNSVKQFAASITVTIIDCSINPPPPDCGAYGLRLNQIDYVTVNTLLQPYRFVQVYTIISCTYSGYFKLQGGLTNGASLNQTDCADETVSQTTKGYNLLKNSSNTVINWISDKSGRCGYTPPQLVAGETRIFKADFNKTIRSWQTDSYGKFDWLTGSWSVKGVNGELLAPYTKRMKVYQVIP